MVKVFITEMSRIYIADYKVAHNEVSFELRKENRSLKIF